VSELKTPEVIERDDGKLALGGQNDAPHPFDSRTDAARIANREKPAPVRARNFRRIKIREVRSDAPA